MIFDRGRQQITLFSGYNGQSTNPQDTWTLTPHHPPRVDDTGPGCNPVTGLTPRLSRVCGYGPWVGGELRLQADQLPPTFPTFPFLIVGFTNPALPLGGLGAPSCTLRANLDLLVGLGSPATWSLTIPNTPTLYGAQLFAQEVSLGLLFPVGSPGWIAAMSNGLGFTIGSR